MSNRFFSHHTPERPHLLRGKGGISGEIKDLRSDVDAAFSALQQEMDLPPDSLQAQLTGAADTQVGTDSVLPWNAETAQQGSGIIYDPETSTINLTRPGTYAVNWSVVTKDLL
jgi:hypothetical protein